MNTVWQSLLFSLPYLLLFIPNVRWRIIDFLRPRSFPQSLVQPIGAAVYTVLLSFLIHTDNLAIAAPLAISYIAFLTSSLYLSYRTSVNTNQVIEQQREKIQSLEKQNSVLKNLNTFEKHIEQLIGKKADRFLREYGLLKQGAPAAITGKTVFQRITQPKVQLQELYLIVANVFQLFFCEPGDGIEYSIMEPKEGRLIFTAWSTRPSSLDWAEYVTGRAFQKGSGFAASSAWAFGKLIIIEDIAAELRKPREGRNYQLTSQRDPSAEGGSLISFPVFDNESKDSFPDGLICVINISSRRQMSFTERDRPFYQYLLDGVACRIILEQRLALLKDLVEQEASDARPS